MTANKSGFHIFHIINKSGHVIKIFHTCNATAFLCAQLMAGPLGCSELSVPAASVQGDSLVHSLAGRWSWWNVAVPSCEITGGLGVGGCFRNCSVLCCQAARSYQ